MWTFLKSKPTGSTRFSEFIRNAPSREKKRVYTKVLERATERQNAILIRQTEPAKGR
jgi:hypothetical protein